MADTQNTDIPVSDIAEKRLITETGVADAWCR